MDSPFLYNRYVTGQRFIGRKEDCTILGNLLSQSENVVMWEPAGTGKKSIVHQVLTRLRVTGVRFTTGEITALDIRSVEVFIRRLGAAVIRLAASTPDEYAQVVAKYLGGTHFVFDRNAFSATDTILSTNWDLDEDDYRAVLRLPYLLTSEIGGKSVLFHKELGLFHKEMCLFPFLI